MLIKILNSRFNNRLVADRIFVNNESPIISVVVPIFEQESILYRHLQAITTCMTVPFEFIVINDASSDNTDREIRKFIEWISSDNGRCLQIKYFKNLWPWFETKCDDFGIRNSKGLYILEIQADMLIKQVGFDKILFDLMEKDTSILALSGRGTHKIDQLNKSLAHQNGSEISDKVFSNKIILKIKYKIKKEASRIYGFENRNDLNAPDNSKYIVNQELDQLKDNIFPSPDVFNFSGSAGFLGKLVELLPYDNQSVINEMIDKESKKIWFGETVMRGPIMINKKSYIALGGFNINAFYLGNDDHDLFVRSRHEKYKVGFTPLNFASPLILGNTRKKRKVKSKIWSKVHRKARARGYNKSELMSQFAKLRH
jgi:hypothetical protein